MARGIAPSSAEALALVGQITRQMDDGDIVDENALAWLHRAALRPSTRAPA